MYKCPKCNSTNTRELWDNTGLGGDIKCNNCNNIWDERSNKMARILLEGNNSGDRFRIRTLQDGRIHLEVGHCCVTEINHIVPVEFLTAVLTYAVLDAGGVEKALDNIIWPKEFVEELVNQIEKR